MNYRDNPTAYAKKIAMALSQSLQAPMLAKVGMRQQDGLLYVTLEPAPPDKSLQKKPERQGKNTTSAEADKSAQSAAYEQMLARDPADLLKLVHRALTDLDEQLALSWIKLVKVSARLPDSPAPLWQEDLLLWASPPIAQTLMRPAPTPISRANPGEVNVRIGGDFSGQMIIGNDNQLHHYVYNVAHGGVLNVATAPIIQPKATPLVVKPKPLARLLDRQAVLSKVQTTLNDRLTLELYAEQGFGKTALMQHIAHRDDFTEQFTDGVVYLPVGKQPAADLLQSLYDEFYEASLPFKPSYAQVRQALRNKQSLIILNGLNLDKEDGEWLLNALPSCTFVLVSLTRIYWQQGEAIALEGLPLPESIALMQIELGRALSETEQAAAKALWTALLGNPLQLRRVAAQVKKDDCSLMALVQSMQAAAQGLAREARPGNAASQPTLSEQALFQTIATRLTPQQQAVLAMMGAMGGVALSAQQSMAITQMPETAQVLQELAQQHLIESAAVGNSYQLSPDLIQAVPQSFDPQPWLTRATDYFTRETSAQSGSQEAVIHLLDWTQSTGQWQQSVTLARHVDPLLALNGQWQQWQEVLSLGLEAAQQGGDHTAEAWMLHQIGTRSLAIGETAPADIALTQALHLREQLGDVAGAAVTRHNLGLIVPPLVSGEDLTASIPANQGANPPSSRLWLTRWPWIVGGIVLSGAIIAGAVLTFLPKKPPSDALEVSVTRLDFGPHELDSSSNPRAVTLTNGSQQSLPLQQISLSGANDFTLDPTGDCQPQVVLEPGVSCELQAIFTPAKLGDRTAEIIVTAGKASSPGSQTIVLSGQGSPEKLPSLSFDTALLDFGQTPLDKRKSAAITLTNDGTAPLNISAFNLVTSTGERTQEYGIDNDEECTSADLEPKGSCLLEIWFEPNTVGSRSVELLVNSNVSQVSELPLIGVGLENNSPQPEKPPLPIANNDEATVSLGSAVTIPVLNNDRDPSGGDLLIVNVSSPQSGKVKIEGDQIIYYSNQEQSTDRFTYTIKNSAGQTAEATVTITVEDPPLPPQANDDEGTVSAGSSVTIPVLDNDIDPNGGTLKIIEVSPGQIGDTKITGNQIVYYHGGKEASNDYSATVVQRIGDRDQFTYTVQNDRGQTAQATVFIFTVPIFQ